MTDKPKKPNTHRPERFEELTGQLREGSRLSKSDLADSIGFLLRLANGVALGELGVKLEAMGLRQSLYSVLLIIRENPGLKQNEIGQTLSIQQSNLVALITELEGDGLVIRQPVANDRRSYSLVLTDKGQKRLAEADAIHTENERRLAEAVGPIAPEDFRKALRRILEM